MIELDDVGVYLGLDVGKGEHHATALTPAGKKLFDKPLPNSEPRLRTLFAKLAKHGQVLVVVDQPASIGALPVTVARDAGCQVAYLPGLTMRRIADLYPGEAKTDARDAFIIADAARTMPHTLRDLDPVDETVAAVHMLLGFDDDLAAEATRTSNRLRGLLTAIHPHLERVLGPRSHHPAVLALFEATGPRPRSAAPESTRPPTCCGPGPHGWAGAWPPMCSQPSTSRTSWCRAPTRPRSSCPASPHPCAPSWTSAKPWPSASKSSWTPTLLSKVLTSMPGIGVRTGAHILVEIGDGWAFPTAAHLAPYAGLAPATRRSGSSIRGEAPPRRGNRLLKRAYFLAAFASLADPTSRAYYDRKIAEGKRHNQALLCLARRRSDVIFAMLRDGAFYQAPASQHPA